MMNIINTNGPVSQEQPRTNGREACSTLAIGHPKNLQEAHRASARLCDISLVNGLPLSM